MTDLEKDQLVADPGLKADPAPQQDLNQPVTGQDDLLADGTKEEDKTVKYAEFKKANEAKKLAEEQAAFAQQQLQIIQANQQPAPQVTQPQAGSTYELAMQQLNLTADDLYDGGNQLRIQNRKAELDMQLQQQQSANTANQQFMTSHPDFNQVVGIVNPANQTIMQWSAEALALKQKKPWLNLQTAQGLYEAVMEERKLLDLEKKAAVNTEHLNRQEIDTNTQPMGGSAAGGGGAGDAKNQVMMTREQSLEIRAKLANGEKV